MTRHEFVFDDLGNFSYSSGPSAIIKHCPKMDGDKEHDNDYEIEESENGRVFVIAPDDWTQREVEYILLDFYNCRARGLVAHLSALDKQEGV